MIEDRKHFIERLQALEPALSHDGSPAAPDPSDDQGSDHSTEAFYLIDARYEVWPDRLQARVARQWIDLTPTELRILILLVERPGRIWRREQLVRACHGGYSTVSDRSVDFIVHHLRRKLGAMGCRIRTARGRGFYFEAQEVRHERRGLSLAPWFFQPIFQWLGHRLRGWQELSPMSTFTVAGVAVVVTAAAVLPFVPVHRLLGPPQVEMLGISELPPNTLDDRSSLAGSDRPGFVGGISGISYGGGNVLVAVSDVDLMREVKGDATRLHHFQFSVDPASRRFEVEVVGAQFLHNADGKPFLSQPALTPMDVASPGFLDRGMNPEGVFVGDDAIWIADEYGGRVMRFDREGRLISEITLPSAFSMKADLSVTTSFELSSGILPFRGLSGVTRTPERGRLFMMAAAPLAQDGGALGTHTRLVRMDPDSGESIQFAYPFDMPYNVVHDVYALDERRLLVLESDTGRIEGFRYCRLHLIDCDQATDVSPLEQVRERFLPEWVRPVAKRTLIDIDAWLSAQGLDIATMSIQGLALGPQLPDGRRLLVIVTDNQYDHSTPTYFLWAAADL